MQLPVAPTISAVTAAAAEDEWKTRPGAVPLGTATRTLVALSEDDALLEALTVAAQGQATVIGSPTVDRFIDQLLASAADIALIDAGAAPAPLEEFLATVQRQFPQLLVILTGPSQLQHQFAARISDGSVFRFAHKPASAQRLKLFVDAALRRLQLSRPQAALIASGLPLPPSMPGMKTGGRSGTRWLLLGAAAAVLAGAGTLWLQHSATSSPPDVLVSPAPVVAAEHPPQLRLPETPAAAVMPTTHGDINREAEPHAHAAVAPPRSANDARLDQTHRFVQLARQRLNTGALIEPVDDSARSYVDAAIALAPDDKDVRSVALDLGAALVMRVRQALAAGDSAQAQAWLQACVDYHVNSATVQQLQARLAAQAVPVPPVQATAPPVVAATAQPAAQSPQNDQLQSLQQQFNQRLSAGQLIQPDGGSALAAYLAMKSADADEAQLSAERHALLHAVAIESQARINRDQLNSAALLLRTVREAGLEDDELANADRALSTARGAVAPVVAATAANPVVAAQNWVPESDLQRAHFVAPVYPADALARGITGSVDLEFTVGANGAVRDIQVRAAQPAGVFDQAAIAALAQTQYVPVQRDGVTVEQRARIKLRFSL